MLLILLAPLSSDLSHFVAFSLKTVVVVVVSVVAFSPGFRCSFVRLCRLSAADYASGLRCGWRRDGLPEADVHLNLDSGLLQVGDKSNPHTTILKILADIIPFDRLGGKTQAVRFDLNTTDFAEDLFKPRDAAFTDPNQIKGWCGAIRTPAPLGSLPVKGTRLSGGTG